MKIVIPMSGSGNRFLKADYKQIKPLILVDGKPIIEHVINLFPGEENFVFVCRREHLEQTNLEDVLRSIKPKAQIVSMEGEKLGPVYAVTKAFDYIKDDEPAIVNYCDFFMDWDYEDFKQKMNEKKCDACLPAYTGFHPHLLPEKNLYASITMDENGFMKEIREKHSFTEDKTLSHHSPGTHYFKKGKYLKKYFDQQIEQNVNLNGEFYASMTFNLLKDDDLSIFVYDKISHFCQWGTPDDLEEYEAWSRLFAKKIGKEKGITVIPDSRKENVKIPYEIGSQKYQNSYNYWKSFFSNFKYHPFK